MQNVTAIVDLQYGSTGKGLLAGYLALRRPFTAVVTAWAPNAGHTFVNSSGRKFVHTQLANAIVSPMISEIFIGPGSVFDPFKMLDEMNASLDLMTGKTLVIHENAAVLHRRHSDAESNLLRIGSTQKGSGAASIERITRDPRSTIVARSADWLSPRFRDCIVSAHEYSARLRAHQHVLVEGHQGFSLSIYHGFYPYTTSRDTSLHAVLADCGIDRARRLEVWGVLRSFPIRVANRFDTDGVMVGWSGPHFSDQHETSWDEIGQQPELTTVTKRTRRVFTYSREQIRQASAINGCDRLFVNFMNYVAKGQRWQFANDVAEDSGVPIHASLYGYGPSEDDVFEPDDIGESNRCHTMRVVP